jgi:hypothetical protein
MHEGGCTDCPWTTVVGVVSRVKYDGLAAPDQGIVYSPMAASARTRYLFVRTDGDARGLLPTLRGVLRDLDPTLPLTSGATVADLMDLALDQPKGLSALAAGFGLVALLLSMIGVYGVMAYYVEQQGREIGIRIALGSSRRRVLGLVLGRGTAVVATGVVVGLVLAGSATTLTKAFLFGVAPLDPVTFGGVALGLLAIAMVSCALPAARAAAADPIAALRNE